jgi:hypothetical protein
MKRCGMGKILLATTRRCPGRSAFKYALQLCREIGADLSILQIRRGRKLPALFPDSYGTGSRHLKKLAREQGVSYTITVQNGQTDKEIVRFTSNQRDILMVVYDKRGILLFEQENEKDLANRLGIPFVTVQNGRLSKTIKAVKTIFTEERMMIGKISNIFKSKNKNEKKKEKVAEAPAMAKEEVQEETARLVVVGNESAFSDSIVDYAMEMAGRMDYQIIALNTAPLSCDTFRLFKNTSNQICEEFQEVSRNNVMPFEQKANENNIPFTHVIKFVETDQALEEIQQEFGEIGFIVSEPESHHAAYNREENENRPSRGLCVYSMR